MVLFIFIIRNSSNIHKELRYQNFLKTIHTYILASSEIWQCFFFVIFHSTLGIKMLKTFQITKPPKKLCSKIPSYPLINQLIYVDS